MKKLPLYYDNQVVGYIDEIIYNDDKIIEFAKLFLFKTSSYDFIIDQIKKSSYSSFDTYINTNDLNNNTLYDFQLIEDYLICQLKNN